MKNHLAISASLTIATAFLAACSSESKSQCTAYRSPSGFDLTTPEVKFRTGIIPILQQSCTFSSCHGGSQSGALSINLRDAAAAHKALVGPNSSQLPTMAFIKPGDPQNSYVMRKMDNDACLLDAQCVGGACGDSMPKNSEVLDSATRDTFRRWIAQGAKDD